MYMDHMQTEINNRQSCHGRKHKIRNRKLGNYPIGKLESVICSRRSRVGFPTKFNERAFLCLEHVSSLPKLISGRRVRVPSKYTRHQWINRWPAIQEAQRVLQELSRNLEQG